MKRLTNKDIATQLNKNVESTITTSENVSRDIYLKCAYFEDLMEKYCLNIPADFEDVFLKFKNCQKENQALKDRWSKLKEIISNKQHIKDKATDFVTLLGASGVEVFCEMLLKEMEKLEEQN